MIRELIARLRRRSRPEEPAARSGEDHALDIRRYAERPYRVGSYFCSEALIKAIRNGFGLPLSDEVIALTSGFPLGMFFGRAAPGDGRVKTVMRLSSELHDGFRSRHRHACCRVLTKGRRIGSREHRDQCVGFTGEVAEETARIILRGVENLFYSRPFAGTTTLAPSSFEALTA